MDKIQTEAVLGIQETQSHPVRDVQVEPLGSDIIRAVNEHVPWGSGCIPVFGTPDFDTHLLFTYCHKICDETFTDTMVLKLLVVDETSATMIRTKLPSSHSESFSLKRTLNKTDFRGVCFAWTELEGDPRGFRLNDRRLAPIFYAFYQDSQNEQRLDCGHSSAACSNYARERVFWVPQDGTQVTSIVCAPLDAYRYRALRLTYTFGLKEEGGPWRYAVKEVPFTPTLWVDLGRLFEIEFKTSSSYLYSVRGPKGKGWLFMQTTDDFNLHHM